MASNMNENMNDEYESHLSYNAASYWHLVSPIKDPIPDGKPIIGKVVRDNSVIHKPDRSGPVVTKTYNDKGDLMLKVVDPKK